MQRANRSVGGGVHGSNSFCAMGLGWPVAIGAIARRPFAPACEAGVESCREAWLPDNRAGGLTPRIAGGARQRSCPCWRSGSSARLEVVRDGVPATLAAVAQDARAARLSRADAAGRHRREQLCEMFWDVPDDPRGALRWSLSKIRPIVDDPARPRLVADRQTRRAAHRGARRRLLCRAGPARTPRPAPTRRSGARAATSFRGPLLADLDLPENSGFHTWLLGLREDARKLQARILRALTERLAATPEEALPYARELVRVDPFDETAWALLIDHLAKAGRSGEIRQQYEAGLRTLREVGGGRGRCCGHGARRRHRRPSGRAQRRERRPAAAGGCKALPSIVVLPFANLSNDPEQQYFADGITGDLTTDLSRIPDMLVISRNTAFTYRNKPIDTKQIGRELGVRYVLEGEVQRSGNQVRVTAQLIDAETDAHLWAERFDRRRRRSVRVAGRDHEPDSGGARPRTGRRGSSPADRASGHARLHFARPRRTAEAAVTREPRGAGAAVRAGVGARSALGRGAELAGDRARRPRPRL